VSFVTQPIFYVVDKLLQRNSMQRTEKLSRTSAWDPKKIGIGRGAGSGAWGESKIINR